ncbi:hypothetical protein [Aureliella helgolandensis]|uniref:Uncharacterized protein n=1 Tax=Aureliella helgolandensis TaxID=2527968 RepID=A0A518GE13_9BACT|nr:hypothetical protein [Aureliella helgolandensis]QDV26797.1 hypothetical protein Q31a_51760 [Aureliella helgolandensis]
MTPLHSFGEFLRQTLMLVPLSWVRVLFVGSLILLLIWVLCLPKSVTTPPEGTQRWDANLKLSAALALVIQILIYAML